MENKKINIGDIIEGIINFNTNGSAYLINENLPKDIFIHKYKINKSLHQDKVKIKVIEGRGRDIEGEVIEIIERNKTEFVGTLEISEKHAFFIPDNKKINVDFFIPLDKLNGGLHNQKVIVKLTEWGKKSKSPNGEVIKIIGNSGEHETEIHAILEEYSLPYEFSDELLSEADLISEIITEEEISKRRDLRNIITFTIDGETAKDLDDALSVEWVNGNIVVGVHIADVSYYVKPNDSIDKEAYDRGTSVYLVDRCIPMLPEKLSNNLCSLNPNTDKLTYSFMFTLDQNGKVINESFFRSIINSNYRLTYTEVQKVIEGGETYTDELKKCILDLNRYAKKLNKNRSINETLTFNSSEIKFILDENNKPTEIYFNVQKDSNKLIEEFMVLTNMRVCEYIHKKNYISIHRTHDKPDQNKLITLKNFVESMGYNLDVSSDDIIKNSLNKLIEETKNTPEENIINNLVVRSMPKATYQTINIGHFGLSAKFYTHTTSPIRRYSDLCIHRHLNDVLGNNGYPIIENELVTSTNITKKKDNLETKCNHITQREIRAQKAERDSNKYMQTIYMSDKIGKIYKGIVTSITEHGFFVELLETKTEGFIRLSEMTNDKYVADVKNYCVKGNMTGEKIKLGDEITVIVKSVDLEKRNINFTLIRL